MMHHHVVGQSMMRWDAGVPVGGRTVANGLAAMPAGVPRTLVEHPLPGHLGWCLVCLLPGAAQTTIFHDPATPNGRARPKPNPGPTALQTTTHNRIPLPLT